MPDPSPENLDPLRLTCGSASARLDGGSLLSLNSLTLDGQELLVAPQALPEGYRVHGARAGITLLHPWANRITRNEISFAGLHGVIADDDPSISRDANALAIHGQKAEPPWKLSSTGPAAGVAELHWPGTTAFPWAHHVSVNLELATVDPDAGVDGPADSVGGQLSLSVTTTVIATGDTAVPVSLGWHPYFHRRNAATLLLPARQTLDQDSRGIPTGKRHPAPAGSVRLDEQGWDVGIAGLGDGVSMALEDADYHVSVTLIDGFGWGQVFAPPDAAVVSLEPMCAPTNALISGEGLLVAEPGQPLRTSFRVTARPMTRPH